MSRLIVGPFNRVEGDLEVKLDISEGEVVKAYVVSPLYRGFENMLRGKAPADALIFAPRICGICSVSQSMAAAYALADADGLEIAPNGLIANNIVHAVENICDHLTHFYLFFMPDFARPVYERSQWYGEAARRFAAVKGEAARDVLPARAAFLHLMGILAGKWPHTLSIRPGGSTRAVSAAEVARMQAIVAGFRHFLQRSLYGDTLERMVSIASVEELAGWARERPATSSDFRHFLAISAAENLEAFGRAGNRFMSFGAYREEAGHRLRRGTHAGGVTSALDPGAIAEDLSSAWYAAADAPQPPRDGVTRPDADRPDAYSWCKAPRLDGQTMEVGAIARQVVDGNPLIGELVAQRGGNVHSRVVARVLEIAQIVLFIEDWLRRLRPGEAFNTRGGERREALGVGLTEAARGALGHWLRVEGGKIANYQIIAPTTWNFSPRDAAGEPGPLELALEGAPVRPGETEPVAVQHIVRSFDPCLVCTVH